VKLRLVVEMEALLKVNISLQTIHVHSRLQLLFGRSHVVWLHDAVR
jgi:hypothetical protein